MNPEPFPCKLGMKCEKSLNGIIRIRILWIFIRIYWPSDYFPCLFPGSREVQVLYGGQGGQRWPFLLLIQSAKVCSCLIKIPCIPYCDGRAQDRLNDCSVQLNQQLMKTWVYFTSCLRKCNSRDNNRYYAFISNVITRLIMVLYLQLINIQIDALGNKHFVCFALLEFWISDGFHLWLAD